MSKERDSSEKEERVEASSTSTWPSESRETEAQHLVPQQRQALMKTKASSWSETRTGRPRPTRPITPTARVKKKADQ